MDLRKYIFSSTKMGQLIIKLTMCPSESKYGNSIFHR